MPLRKPKLGQNFLSSPAARQRIVSELGEIGDRTVLEIGPGQGAITDLLVPRAHALVAVELDRELAPRLQQKWAANSHVSILHADILTLDLTALAHEQSVGKLIVVGNLPYYITSDILLHLLDHTAVIDRAVIMVQEEVADRICAQPGVRDYGVLSATAQMHARAEKLFALPPSAFTPPPKVNSAVVRLTMRPRFVELQVDRSGFLRFLQRCFQQKRKTLANNLKAAGFGNEILPLLERVGLSLSIRAEAVPLEAMAQLYRNLQIKVPHSIQNQV
jgi:16S rRNA (adenine1518-N6/adenine1519-N6)-dimethyltransferase